MPAEAREPLASGLGEMAVFDPGSHERGAPSVEFIDDPEHNGLTVDIPPAVHVHRYYYSGDKEFQGPIIRGGPTIVVASHPKTGQRMYVEVTLPQGAPVIAHSKRAITYVYRDRRVSIVFAGSPFTEEKVLVKNQSGRGLGRTAHRVAGRIGGEVNSLVEGAPPLFHDAAHLMLGVTDLTRETLERGSSLAESAVRMIPGVNNLISRGEEFGVNRRLDEVRRAARIQERQQPQFVPTIR